MCSWLLCFSNLIGSIVHILSCRSHQSSFQEGHPLGKVMQVCISSKLWQRGQQIQGVLHTSWGLHWFAICWQKTSRKGIICILTMLQHCFVKCRSVGFPGWWDCVNIGVSVCISIFKKSEVPHLCVWKTASMIRGFLLPLFYSTAHDFQLVYHGCRHVQEFRAQNF